MDKLNENIFHLYNNWKKGYVRKENSVKMKLQEFLANSKNYTYKTYNESDFTISEGGDKVDVNIEDFQLTGNFEKLPFPIGKCKKLTIACCFKLKSLEGCPDEVDECTIKWCNSLTSLKGAPKNVKYDFICKDNAILESLDGCPKTVGGKCGISQNMSLTSLIGAPEKVGAFDCKFSVITTLEGAPKEVKGIFNCNNCDSLVSLIGAPKKCNSFSCEYCGELKSLEGAPEKVTNYFSCLGCFDLESVKDLPKKMKTLYINDKYMDDIPSDVKYEVILDR